MGAEDDATLVRRCLRGDDAAVRRLIEQFQDAVYGLSVKMLGHRQDAEDVTQEVFVRVFRSLRGWDATRPLKPWVLMIAANRCRPKVRSNCSTTAIGCGSRTSISRNWIENE